MELLDTLVSNDCLCFKKLYSLLWVSRLRNLGADCCTRSCLRFRRWLWWQGYRPPSIGSDLRFWRLLWWLYDWTRDPPQCFRSDWNRGPHISFRRLHRSSDSWFDDGISRWLRRLNRGQIFFFTVAVVATALALTAYTASADAFTPIIEIPGAHCAIGIWAIIPPKRIHSAILAHTACALALATYHCTRSGWCVLKIYHVL